MEHQFGSLEHIPLPNVEKMGYDTKKLKEQKERYRPDKQYHPLLVAEQLLEWVKKEDSLTISQFCAEMGFSHRTINYLVAQDAVMEEAMDITKITLAARREKLLHEDNINYGSWARYASYYDGFLHDYEQDLADKEAKRRKPPETQFTINLEKLVDMVKDGKIKQE